ncbi:hypothetical protein ACROYT_G033171 [Oculina patagonica]
MAKMFCRKNTSQDLLSLLSTAYSLLLLRINSASGQAMDYCHSSPCQNNGTCVSLSDNYICVCPDPFEGHSCEVRNHCQSSTCQNNGTCENLPDSYTCDCPEGYSGSNCEENFPSSGVLSQRGDEAPVEKAVFDTRFAVIPIVLFIAFLGGSLFVFVRSHRKYKRRYGWSKLGED